jgi:hypothetical protein
LYLHAGLSEVAGDSAQVPLVSRERRAQGVESGVGLQSRRHRALRPVRAGRHRRRKVLEIDRSLSGQCSGNANRLVEFAYVQRPVVLEQRAACARRKAEGPEVWDAGKDDAEIFDAIAQRRQSKDERGKPGEEVTSEFPPPDQILERSVRRGDDAQVELDWTYSAYRQYLVFLQDAQEGGLRRAREVADFVEEQSAVGGAPNEARCVADGTGESAADVTEQLRFEQGGGERGAIDRNEGSTATG